jgi:soluble lytic murein transglycosylase-like protein
MLAKSATQLFGFDHKMGSTLRLRRMVVLLTLALFGAGVIWLVDACDEEALRVASVLQSKAPAGATAVAADTPVPSALVAEPPHEERHHALSQFLARRYNVSQEVTLDLVTLAHAAGRQMGLDPLLIIAVMAVESRFNPLAESVAGAKGVMQVIPRYHVAKFREVAGDKWSVFDPETNIIVGAQILKEYLRRTGNLTAALQLYVGAPEDENDGYTGRVMGEKQRLQQFLRSVGPRAQSRRTDAAPTSPTS